MTSLLSTVVSPSPSSPSSAPTFTFSSSSATRRRAHSRHDDTPTAGQPRCLAVGNASSSTTAFRAPRRRERQRVQMYAELATAAAAGVGERSIMPVQVYYSLPRPLRRTAEFSPGDTLCCQAGDGHFSTRIWTFCDSARIPGVYPGMAERADKSVLVS